MLLIFFITIITGAVYAAASGVLTLTGNVNLHRNADVRLKPDFYTDAVSIRGNGYGNYTVDSTGKVATFNVVLREPGDMLTFKYGVENVGSTNARITAIPNINNPTVLNITNFFDGVNLVMSPYSTISGCELTIEWKLGENDNANGDFSFTLELDYQYTTDQANWP